MNAEQTEVNLLVTRAFDALRIPYFLCGSMASSVHGIYRATADADFVAAVRAHQIDPFAASLQHAFYADAAAIREAVAHGRSFNLIHLQTMLKADVFVLRPDPFQLTQMRRRVRTSIDENGSQTLFVASAEDTILAKLDWFRQTGGTSDRQWNDILGVLKVQGDALDRAHLAEWARELQLTHLLLRAYNDAGFEI